MNRLHSLSLIIFATGMAVISGCKLQTLTADPPNLSPSGNLVINEVFTLPATNQTPYSWIEFYNPTPDTINLTGWNLNFQTWRLEQTVVVSLDSVFGFGAFISQTVIPDSFGRFDVPFGEAILGIPELPEDTVKLPPGGLFTIVNDEDRLLDHIEWGPGDERFRRERPLIASELLSFSITDTNIVIVGTDTTILGYTAVVKVRAFEWVFQPVDQLVLKDPAGVVIDVVRYGNYQYPGPGADPYPNNVTLGMLPEFQSIQRWAEAYFTANSANDFYVSSSSVVSTPQWYSLLHKR